MTKGLATAGERAAGWFWPAFIIFLLAIPVASVTVLIRAATGDESLGVEVNYYERGLAWDDEARQRAANESLGWGFELLAGRAGGQRLLVQARLLDSEGGALSAESVTIEAFAVARAAHRIQLVATRAEDGSWEAAAALTRGGLWEFRCEARAEGHRFTEVLRRDLGSMGARP